MADECLATAALTHSVARQQSRDTPPNLARAIAAVMPIGLDPCASATSTIPADLEVVLPFYADKEGKTIVANGLRVDWLALARGKGIYVNCPWASLEDWIEKAWLEAQRGAEVMMLLPVRTHRAHWGPIWRFRLHGYLRPIEFVGFDNAMPTPCVLAYEGPRWAQVAAGLAAWGHWTTGVTPAELAIVARLVQGAPEGSLRRLLAGVGKTSGHISALIEKRLAASTGAMLLGSRVTEALQEGEKTSTELSRALGVSSSTVIRELRAQESRGLVSRRGVYRNTRWRACQR